jgi:hypothetical protein
MRIHFGDSNSQLLKILSLREIPLKSIDTKKAQKRFTNTNSKNPTIPLQKTNSLSLHSQPLIFQGTTNFEIRNRGENISIFYS